MAPKILSCTYRDEQPLFDRYNFVAVTSLYRVKDRSLLLLFFCNGNVSTLFLVSWQSRRSCYIDARLRVTPVSLSSSCLVVLPPSLPWSGSSVSLLGLLVFTSDPTHSLSFSLSSHLAPGDRFVVPYSRCVLLHAASLPNNIFVSFALFIRLPFGRLRSSFFLKRNK